MKTQRQIDRLLAQRAAEWMEVLKTGGERERAEFAAWLRQSKLHVEHYLELVAINQELRLLDAAQCPDVEALLAQAAPNVVAINQGIAASDTQQRLSRRFSASGVKLAIAAGIAAVAVSLTVFLWPRHQISTATGEQRTVSLPDGSVVTLNTQTDIRVDFSAEKRTIVLKSGEAVFKVAQDRSRPFVVYTQTASVRALGTQFNVYQRPDDIVVSVLEGRVQVTAGKTAVQNLSAGEQAQVAPTGKIQKRAAADVQQALAWRERRLSFDETPLAEVVHEFNRYGGPVQLRLEGEPSERYRYSGVFDADDPEALAALLSRESDLIVARKGAEIVIWVR